MNLYFVRYEAPPKRIRTHNAVVMDPTCGHMFVEADHILDVPAQVAETNPTFLCKHLRPATPGEVFTWNSTQGTK